jgi:hypothetical protein
MANHPNRAIPEIEPKMEFVLQMAGNLVTAASKALGTDQNSPEFEKSRKQALRATRQTLKALQMMGGEASTPAA